MWVFPGFTPGHLDDMAADELIAWHKRAVERKQVDLNAMSNAIAGLMRAMAGKG